MPVLVLDPLPAKLEALLEQRRLTGADRFDEMWEGVLHMNPAPRRRHATLNSRLISLLDPLARAAGLETADNFNVGGEDSYRIPDSGLLRPGPDELYIPTAALVIEVLSPRDETWDKLPFYAAHDVDEVLIVDPLKHRIDWLALDGDQYKPIEHSRVIDLGPTQLAAQIDWPATGD